MALHLGWSPKWFLSHLETQGWFSVLPGTWNLDTTSLDMGVTIAWCSGAVGWWRDYKMCQLVSFLVSDIYCANLQLLAAVLHDVIISWYVICIHLSLVILILFLS
jgi:hypothetical protein